MSSTYAADPVYDTLDTVLLYTDPANSKDDSVMLSTDPADPVDNPVMSSTDLASYLRLNLFYCFSSPLDLYQTYTCHEWH